MKPTEKQKKEIRKYIEKWRGKLFLHEWGFDIIYSDDVDEAAAMVRMNGQYKEAGIYIYEKFWKLSKEKREFSLVHELCHCVVQPLIELICQGQNGQLISQREIDWNKEQVTQHVANSIFYLK